MNNIISNIKYALTIFQISKKSDIEKLQELKKELQEIIIDIDNRIGG